MHPIPQAKPSVNFFAPQSIAIVGASERSAWARQLYENLRAWPFGGRIHCVHWQGAGFFGQRSHTACDRIEQPIDLAFLLLPMDSLPNALEDVARANIRHAIVLTSGFAEAGPEGARRQRELVQLSSRLGVRLMGPNSLGFINYNLGIPCWPVHMKPMGGGAVAVVSQSGAMGGYIAKIAQQQGVGVGFLAATGNEAAMGLHDVLDVVTSDPKIRVVALFAEAIRDPASFAAAARRAAGRRQSIVVLKVGRSELTARSAQAHTGALVGNDGVFDAACRELGLIRVDSMEELVETAGLLASTGPLPKGNVAAVSVSGGAAEIFADDCDREAVALPPFSQETERRLRDGVVPSYGTIHNPLDITGAAITDPSLFRLGVSALADDPEIGIVTCLLEVPSDVQDNPNAMNALREIGAAFRASKSPGVVVNVVAKPLGPEVRQFLTEHGVPHVVSGIGWATKGLRHAQTWSRWLEARTQSADSCTPAQPPASRQDIGGARPHDEYTALLHLRRFGVPVIEARPAASAEQAVQLAMDIGGPIALKINSPDIPHKSDVGGVVLNLDTVEAVADGYERIMASVRRRAPQARIDGVLVTPMRTGGVEVFAGVQRDPQWGWVLAVGLGGVLVEVLKDVSLRLLPVTPAAVLEMLEELRGAPLLKGFRGTAPIDIGALASTIVGIGEAALALGDDLEAFEVNPIHADSERAEALDALAVWRSDAIRKDLA